MTKLTIFLIEGVAFGIGTGLGLGLGLSAFGALARALGLI